MLYICIYQLQGIQYSLLHRYISMLHCYSMLHCSGQGLSNIYLVRTPLPTSTFTSMSLPVQNTVAGVGMRAFVAGEIIREGRTWVVAAVAPPEAAASDRASLAPVRRLPLPAPISLGPSGRWAGALGPRVCRLGGRAG